MPFYTMEKKEERKKKDSSSIYLPCKQSFLGNPVFQQVNK